MNLEIQELIRTLASGKSVPTTPKLVAALQDAGINCIYQNGQAAIETPLELLDADRIGEGLAEDIGRYLSQLDIFWSIDSTNTWLLERASEANFHGHLCLAEQQIAGKGRRGRHWVSPFGKNVYLSLGWRMSTAHANVAGLSLVVGMQVVRALQEQGLQHIGLKWPNDVLLGGGKLAGILVELAASPRDEARLVIGMGVNLRLDPHDASRIDQKFSTVSDQMVISRNALVASIINNVVPELARFSLTGFAPYAPHWNEFDLYKGLPVRVSLAGGIAVGINRGVDKGGNLLLETDQGIQSFNAGEVSLRVAD